MNTLNALQESRPRFEKIITCSDLMLPIFDQTIRAAEVDVSVLITGESGTGKELIAEAIHANSPRQSGPFVVVNMAAVPETLMESELFGHVAGAFTDAGAKRIGRFEAAHQGTLFIDEIGDLPLKCQAKLLRVLENHHVTPVGSNEEKSPDVRVIAATNQNLAEMVRDGRFRDELYYRLNVVAIHLPPLRDRPEDIEPLVNHFLRELAESYGRPQPAPERELMDFLRSYAWPGNIRQLRNCVESMFVLADSTALTVDDLPETIRRVSRGDTVRLRFPPGLTLDEVQKSLVYQTLERCHENRTRAADSLGISIRTLQRWLRRWERGEQERRLREVGATPG